MRKIIYGVLLIAFPGILFGTEMTFREIVKNVEYREPRTGAIRSVRSSAEKRAKGSLATYSSFEIRIKDKTARVEMYNNYLTGKKGEVFSFPVGPEIKAEHARLKTLERLRVLDKAVADAERKRRIFVSSSFKLQEGSSREQAEAVFGRPESVSNHMRVAGKRWSTNGCPSSLRTTKCTTFSQTVVDSGRPAALRRQHHLPAVQPHRCGEQENGRRCIQLHQGPQPPRA